MGNSQDIEIWQKKVSIVIPCYNVEQYVEKCLDSVIHQTYVNLEIICIDDGSTDTTGIKLDLIAQRDKRIQIIHQKNQGLAETRNIGKEIATGSYIYFLDSDDYIDMNAIEEMVRMAVENDADIIVSGFYMEFANGKKIRNYKRNVKICLSSSEALGLFLYTRYINPIACAKLYKSELLKDIWYPKGKLYEDMSTTYKVLEKSEKIIYTSSPYYHYIQRQGSIGKIANRQVNIQLERAVDEYWKTIKENMQIAQIACVGRAFWHLVVYNRLICAGSKDLRLADKLKYEITIGNVIKCKYISVRKKIKLLLFKISPSIYSELYKGFYVKKTGKMMK